MTWLRQDVDMDEQEERLKSRRKAKQPKLTMLMEYRHIDPKHLGDADAENVDLVDGDDAERSSVDVDAVALAVDDDVFLDLLKEKDSRVGFVLTKSTS